MRIRLLLRRWMIFPVMGLIWLLALLYGSGIGMAYDVYGKAKLLVLGLTLLLILRSEYYRCMPKIVFCLILYISSCTFITSYLYGKDMLDYLWLYLLIPLIGYLPVEDAPIHMVSVLYGALGMIVLFLANYHTLFSGWNPNSLAMIAFFSFSVMIASFSKISDWKIVGLLLVYVFIYFEWSSPLNSRAGVLFTVLMLLGVFGVLPFRKWLGNQRMLSLLLLAPCMVAVFIVLIKNISIIQELEAWSIATFDKPLFNGRDVLWETGFQRFFQSPIIGNGDLSFRNWHNSAVTVLVGGGILGFVIWIKGIKFILMRCCIYLEDNIVFGLMLGFIMIWLQQTVELGLVAGQANAIPYAMLGLLIGRVRTLEGKNVSQDIDYYSSL